MNSYDKMPQKKINKGALGYINATSGKIKLNIVIYLLLEMFLAVCGIYLAIILRNIVDVAVTGDEKEFWKTVIIFSADIAIMITGWAIIRFLTEFTKASIENKLKERLFSNILRRDYAGVSAIHSAEWLNRLTSDTVVVADGTTAIIPQTAGMLVKLVGAVVALLILEPKFLFVIVPGGVVLLVFTYAFRKKLKRLHKDIQESDGALRVYMSERIENLMIVKAYEREDDTLSEATELMKAHKNSRIRRNHFSNASNTGFSVAMNGAYIIGAVFCGYGILTKSMSYGTFTAVLQLVGMAQGPLANLTGFLPKYYSTVASAERLMEIEETVLDEKDDKITDFDKIVFENVSFSYTGAERKAIDNLKLTIDKGDSILFRGPSGCGKSTALKLMMDMYKPDTGELYITVGEKKERISRSLFAYVPQGNRLMAGSIKEVVSFGDAYDPDRLSKALYVACADEFVDELETKADTILGEKGAGLSEGQMQRIAIARAIYSERPVLLLDEITSSLDRETAGKVLDRIKKENKTVVLVSHRMDDGMLCNKEITFSE